MTSSGVPVGDATLLAKLRERAASEDFVALNMDDLAAIVTLIEAAQRLYETHELQMYVGSEAVSGGHIGYCTRALSAALAPFVGEAT